MPPPTNAAPAPSVGVSELAVSSSGPSTTRGSPAESQEEAVDGQGGEAHRVDPAAHAAGEHQDRHAEREDDPDGVAPHEDLPALPAVEQHARERPDDRERREHHRERARDRRGRALRLGEKNSSDARPTWNMPSPACDTSRTANSRRKPSRRSSPELGDHTHTFTLRFVVAAGTCGCPPCATASVGCRCAWRRSARERGGVGRLGLSGGWARRVYHPPLVPRGSRQTRHDAARPPALPVPSHRRPWLRPPSRESLAPRGGGLAREVERGSARQSPSRRDRAPVAGETTAERVGRARMRRASSRAREPTADRPWRGRGSPSTENAPPVNRTRALPRSVQISARPCRSR